MNRTEITEMMTPGPESTIDCPTWCTLPNGHRYDAHDHPAELVRTHERLIGASGRFSVELGQHEQAGTVDGPVTSDETAHALIVLSGAQLDADLNADDCRQLAALLADAADTLDSITTPATA